MPTPRALAARRPLSRALLCLLLLIAALLTACGGSDGAAASEAYRTWAAAARTLTAEWTVQESRYAGVLAIGPATGDGDRLLSLTYTAPEALAGVTLTRSGGEVTVTLEGLSFTGGEEYANAFRIFRFFTCEGQGHTLETAEGGGSILQFLDTEGVYAAHFPAGGAAPTHLTYTAPGLALSLTVKGEGEL